ncbi:DUF6326 family protein [Arthrospiribacter ruber]|uniref:Uncharacterized protein n=1 Tax=Arthrospiribacter ruber TaxID=2487934 RepID=A0A951ITC7_9BACT|nr:DUF6326 family protein [Arthrospiribacter ruber]MBW3466933.1 hypothetical protein [Arthrospiribacter ruber]
MTQIKPKNSYQLENDKINIKIKLAALWTTLMFLYIYADYFQLKTPGTIENIMNLKTPVGPTTPGLLIIFSVLLIIPSLMIFLSIFFKPQLSKWLNIIFSLIYGAISILIIVSGMGDKWQAFFVLYNVIEVFIFIMIIWQAWNWPKTEKYEK